MWRAAARRGTAALGITLAAHGAAIAGPLSSIAAPPPALSDHAPEHATVRALRGLAALDRGYPVVRWGRPSVSSASAATDDRGGMWLRVGHDTDGEASAPGAGRRLRAGSAQVAAPFPFFPLAGGDDFFAQLWLRAGTRAGVRAEYHVMELADPRSPWCGVAGHAAAGDQLGGRRELAHIVGIGLVLALSDHVGVEAQYGHALGPALADPAWPGGAAHYGYLELTLRY